jgi:hypothetical protein
VLPKSFASTSIDAKPSGLRIAATKRRTDDCPAASNSRAEAEMPLEFSHLVNPRNLRFAFDRRLGMHT